MENQFEYSLNITDDIVATVTQGYNTTDAHMKQYEPVKIPSDIAWIGVTLGSLIIAVGIFGNILVVVAIITSKPLCKFSNAFVASLALWDLFQTVLVRPFFIHTYRMREWTFSPSICVYVLYASNLAILESIVHVAAIGLYRYVIICHENIARRMTGKKAVGSLLVALYLLPLTLILGPSIPRLSPLQVTFNTHIMFCAFKKQSDTRIVGILKKLLFLSIAAAFLFYCYIRIYHVVRQSGRYFDSVNQDDRTRSRLSPTRLRREMALLKTVLVVFCSFVVSYLPLTVIYGVDRGLHLPYELYFVGVLLLWMSSSVNWMIYGLMNRRFLYAYRRLLCGWWGRRRGVGKYNDSTPKSSRRSVWSESRHNILKQKNTIDKRTLSLRAPDKNKRVQLEKRANTVPHITPPPVGRSARFEVDIDKDAWLPLEAAGEILNHDVSRRQQMWKKEQAEFRELKGDLTNTEKVLGLSLIRTPITNGKIHSKSPCKRMTCTRL